MHTKRKILSVVCVLVLGLALTGCRLFTSTSAQKIQRPTVTSSEQQLQEPTAGDTIAVFETSAGTFRAKLFVEQAPQACENFIELVQSGYYNGLTFSRVESGFIAQAGQDADGGTATIWNNNGYPAEVSDELHHYTGALCMALNEQDKATSVFYVMQTLPDSVTDELVEQMNAQGWRSAVIEAYQAGGGAPYLDYTDTVFGQVYDGMDVVDVIAQTEANEDGKPLADITIRSVSIETIAE